ncbi:MAG: deoxyribose-phosphate aldolase [Gammaproteobacteria bacterium RIFCSPHIGHO2_12_FULL_37_14]|nr:MAG: deoxyribose-phosphate aldolase [Gammaproteobacteria bacterium RIFCSPHIGHO2_12_FULL_37_14]
MTKALLQRLFSLLDLTSLNESDNNDTIAAFFEKANSVYGHVAAVCIYPRFVRLAVTQFAGSPIKVATVVNFPEGSSSLSDVLIEINQALEDGAQEIDMVFPYSRYLAGEQQYSRDFISACRAACGAKAVLKVILETGALGDSVIIADACYAAMMAGADFVKTSTGKIAQGATLEAAAAMLLVIKHARAQLKHEVGLKVSGGIRDIQQAAQYMQLLENMMGSAWITPHTFRIGASQLVNEILAQ